MIRTNLVDSLLLIDDEIESESVRPLINRLQMVDGYPVRAVRSSEEASHVLKTEEDKIWVVLVDQIFADGSTGIDAIKTLKDRHPLVEIILITGFQQGDDTVSAAIAAGAYGFHMKGEAHSDLKHLIEGAAREARSKRENAVLRDMDREIYLAETPESCWRRIMEAAARLTGARVGQILEHDPQRGQLILRASKGTPRKYAGLMLDAGEVIKDAEKSISRLVIRTGRFILIKRLSEDPLSLEYKTLVPDMQSSLTVPIRRIDQPQEVHGIINIEDAEPDKFDLHDASILEQIADRAAIAIDDVQQRTLLKDSTQRYKALYARFRALYESGKEITSSLKLDDVLLTILKQGHALVRAQYSSFLITVPGEQTLELRYKWPLEESGNFRLDTGYRFPFHREYLGQNRDGRIGLVARAAQQRKVKRVGDVTRDPDYLECTSGIVSELVVPLMSRERLFGVLNFESKSPNAFDAGDEEFICSLAAQAVIAVSNAHQAEQLAKVAHSLNQQMVVTSFALAHGVWGHDVSKSAFQVSGYVEVLRQELQSLVQRGVDISGISSILQEIGEAANSIQRAMSSAAMPNIMTTELVPLNDFCIAYCQHIESVYKTRLPRLNVSFNSELLDEACVWVSREWLALALRKLCDNSVAAMESTSGETTISVSLSALRDQVEIRIIDTGPGIPKSIREQLGNLQVQKIGRTTGLGMGFLIAATVVRAFGGDIFPEEGKKGAIICIRLPLRER